MLHEFLTKERKTILEAAKRKAAEARWRAKPEVIEEGWGIFYDELTGFLGRGVHPESEKGVEVSSSAIQSGKEYLRLGLAITEAVQSYNIIYQAITESATNLGVVISPEEFEQLNHSLDTAIADVVTEFEKVQTEAQGQKETERLGFLAHELRNCIQTASLSLEMIRSGVVGGQGKTSEVLEHSLARMATLIDTALAGVRMRLEPAATMESVRTCDLMTEVQVVAGFHARKRNIRLEFICASEREITVDRHLFVSALSNLVQNAIKFSQEGGKVTIRAHVDDELVSIEVEDECGGLPPGEIEDLFKAGVQVGKDRTGVGLGLAISRQAVERNGGTLTAKNLPNKGCVFIIELPNKQEAVDKGELVLESAPAEQDLLGAASLPTENSKKIALP